MSETEKNKTVFVTISGPHQVGKSFAANKLAAWLRREIGADVVVRRSVETDDDPDEMDEWQKKMMKGPVWIIGERNE